MKQLLSHRGFRLLLIGQGVSAFGDWMVTVALIALVLRLSGSSTAVGAVLVLRLSPAAVAGPLAARAAERWDRRRTMLAMDVLRAGMVAVIPLIDRLAWVYIWSVVLEVASLVFLPARDASIPDLVAGEDLPLANGLVLGSSYGVIPVAAGVFAVFAALSPKGGLLGGHPFALVFWADALTFLVSFACIRQLTNLGRVGSAQSDGAGAGAAQERGFRAAFRIPLVRLVLAPTAAVALGLGSLFSVGVVYVRDVLKASDASFGILIAMFGVGAAAGLTILRALNDTDSLATVRVAVIIQGGTIAFMSLVDRLVPTFLGAAGFGAMTAITLAAGMSALQERLSGEDRVLAFAAFHVVIRVGLSLAALVAGGANDLLAAVTFPILGSVEPARMILVCAGVLVILSGLLVHPLHEQQVSNAGPNGVDITWVDPNGVDSSGFDPLGGLS
jgi:predicted MFS family arabinose efflux permease